MAVKPLVPISPEAFRKEMEDKGWTPAMLGVRWGLKTRRIYQIIADEERPPYYDEALHNLPIIEK